VRVSRAGTPREQHNEENGETDGERTEEHEPRKNQAHGPAGHGDLRVEARELVVVPPSSSVIASLPSLATLDAAAALLVVLVMLVLLLMLLAAAAPKSFPNRSEHSGHCSAPRRNRKAAWRLYPSLARLASLFG